MKSVQKKLNFLKKALYIHSNIKHFYIRLMTSAAATTRQKYKTTQRDTKRWITNYIEFRPKHCQPHQLPPPPFLSQLLFMLSGYTAAVC